jgi:hypothetical protein
MGWCIAERKYAEEARERELRVVVVMEQVYRAVAGSGKMQKRL